MAETIPALFFRQAAAQKEETLFLVKRHGAYAPISWRQAADDIAALATFLLDRHVNPDDRILILSENRPEWGLADIAIQSVGAWSVPVYPSLTAQDLQVICADCQPTLCIASTLEQSQKLLAVMTAVPSMHGILLMDGAAPGDPCIIPWSEEIGRAHV